ncbi:MAG: hypothetical protein AMJ68_02380 [Acidithiobacillales bacterium SG8_45]|jgi:hypothetical protein|nr:MAG: hypothetical protein AMJ68_02380 [Acidithiobacillales bacterium SG8_45]
METITHYTIAPVHFPKFYRLLSGLRFPIKVAEVLELRSVLNEAVDKFEEPDDSPSYREFVEALETAIHSFGIEGRRHADRLIRLLTLLRDTHYQHSINSRDKEVELRTRLEDTQLARTRSIRYGLVAMLVAIGSAIYWAAMPEANWMIKGLTLLSTYLSWDFFHSLPTLDREQKSINKELNDLLRERISNVDWKMLIHKLSLLMGYKKVSGVEVFNMDEDFEPGNSTSHLQ